ncbi:MAG: tetratricopeptide repeat protein [Planctomycetes bacterium]|nr:tetratricopeptide repeat protein [Planctomycetota bacterium]
MGTSWQAIRANRLLTSERLARSQLVESKTREVQHATQVSAAIDSALAQSERLQQQTMWPEAIAAVKRAESLLSGASNSETSQRTIQDRLADLNMIAELEKIRLEWHSIVDEGYFDDQKTDRAYQRAFKQYGLNPDSLDPDQAAARIRSRSVWLQLVTALDHWALVRQTLKDRDGSRSLLAVARRADADEWRNRLRNLSDKSDRTDADKELLANLAASAAIDRLAPSALVRLGELIESVGETDRAIELLRQAQQKHPDDFWINMRLAQYLANWKVKGWDESVRFSTVAVALRPTNPAAHIQLGSAFATPNSSHGRAGEAIPVLREAIRLDPKSAWAYSILGRALLRSEADLDEAIAAHRKAIRLNPENAWAYKLLSTALLKKGKLDEAVTASRESVRLAPNDHQYHTNLGTALAEKGNFDEAIAAYRKIIELIPKGWRAYSNLGTALAKKGKVDQAIAEYRKAIELNPKRWQFHANLGVVLAKKGNVDKAIAAYH